MRLPRTYPLVVGLVLIGLIVSAVLVLGRQSGSRTATVYFTKTVGLYEGDDVDILGVPVGKVIRIQPEGNQVRVDVTYDASHDVPAEAKAVIVAPTLVTGRYVQLAPAYGGGPKLADGGSIPLQRTAVPVEFDEVKEQLSRLSADLGPNGVNKDGSLNKFLDSAAHALDGQGVPLRQTLSNLSQAASTLDTHSDDLFATIRNLQSFVSNLASSGTQIEGFSSELSGAAQLLNDNHTELSAALNSLEPALRSVRSFITDNRGKLNTDLDSLTRISRLLVDKEDSIAGALHVAPTALSNFYNIFTPLSNSLTGVLSLNNLQNPALQVCSILVTVGAPPAECTTALKPLLDLVSMEGPPIGLSPIERNGDPNVAVPPGGTPQQSPAPGAATNQPGPLPGIGGTDNAKTLSDLLLPIGGK
jgi:phospholipid/cholesterol/gamma-HCH transport system substrate-binding protein